MNRLAVLLLAGATFVAAQDVTETATETGDEQVTTTSEETTPDCERMREKLREAFEKAGDKAERARVAAEEFLRGMKGKSGEEADRALEQKRAEINERIQGAIDAIDRHGERVGCQVEEVRERIQSKMQEKREKLVELQERIRAREQARDEAKQTGRGDRGQRGGDEEGTVTEEAAQ